MNWEESDRLEAFKIISEENYRLNCYSPIANKQDLFQRLEDIALELQGLSFQDQKANNQNWSSYQYSVLDIMESIHYLKENLKDEV